MLMQVTELRAGDILNTVSDPCFPLHWPIATGTDNPFVHTAVFEKGTVAISALADGVQRRELPQWDRFILVTRFPYPHVAQAALNEIMKMIGTPYDVAGIIADGIEAVSGQELPDTQGNGVTCSRLIAEGFKRAGAVLVKDQSIADVTPRDLVERSLLEVVGYMRTR